MNNLIKHFIVVCLALVTSSCTTYYFRSNYDNQNSLLFTVQNSTEKYFLKAHLANGDVCIFKDLWEIDTLRNQIIGSGTLYDFNRKTININVTSIPIESVVIFETNRKLENTESTRIAALTLLTAMDVTLGVVCITNPKACYGSCPTFYTTENADKDIHYADAEGFSSSILPSMEISDIDAIHQHYYDSGNFSISMKNEALETHCVNEVKLMVYPLNENENVYQSNTNIFYLCKQPILPTSAIAEEGDVLSLLTNLDKTERFSLSDSTDLRTREEIFVTFDHVNAYKQLGIILDYRQSLLSTFLFYNAMGYMGNEMSDYFARLEKSETLKSKYENIKKELGGIDVFVLNELSNKWEFQDTFYEFGPIAINTQLIALKSLRTNSQLKVKLCMNKGTWRIDRINLAEITKEIQPQIIKPTEILKDGIENPEAMMLNSNPSKYIVSMPGNIYNFKFTLPLENTNYEMFIFSKGYYLEWMRNDWLKEKDIATLKEMYIFPKSYLRKQAKVYKIYETQMEEIFWNSKITSTQFSK